MRAVFIIFLALIFAFNSKIYAQKELKSNEEDLLRQEKKEAGVVFTMAETGTGFGGFYAIPFATSFHFGATIDVFFLRDSKEFEGVDYYGYYFSVNKVNNVYLFDAMLTLKKRFFAEDLHESFRPFLSGGIGPVYGMNFPEVDQLPDQKAFTFGGFVGAGTDISMDNKFFASIRVQYRFLPFSSYLGEKKNHSMAELRIELGKRF